MTKKKTFEESMDRLNELVSILERNETPLEKTVESFEEGLKLVQHLEATLHSYEEKVAELKKVNEEYDNEN